MAERTFVVAGAVVIKNTDPDSVYVDNPARKLDRSSLEMTSLKKTPELIIADKAI